MGLQKIQTILTVHFTNFKRIAQDSTVALYLYTWKQIEKGNVVSLDDTMLPEIIRIQNEGFGNGRNNGVRRYSKRLKKVFYVIKYQDHIAGYCIYSLKIMPSFKGFKKSSILHSIAIDRDFRRKGLGEKLLNGSIKEMKLNKIPSILLYVNKKNLSAIHLYEKLGFQIIKEVRDICGQDEKCYEMKLKLE